MFHLYDVDGDGYITKQDLNTVVSAVHNLIGSSGPGDHAINQQVFRIFEVSVCTTHSRIIFFIYKVQSGCQCLNYIGKIILVYYCKCCNLIGYSTHFSFLDRQRIA